jgi:hypothetical protein
VLLQVRSDGENGNEEEEAKGKQYSMLMEELEAREQAHADELTAQAEEIINLQDEIKDAGAALEAKDSEVTQLRFQLMLVEKYYKEKKEEHSNLAASMKAVEGIWERERSNAAQREQVQAMRCSSVCVCDIPCVASKCTEPSEAGSDDGKQAAAEIVGGTGEAVGNQLSATNARRGPSRGAFENRESTEGAGE